MQASTKATSPQDPGQALGDRALTPESYVRTIFGAKTRVYSYGPADAEHTIVAVHGFRGDHHGLQRLIAALPTQLRVIVPELPGFGESKPFRDHAHTVENYAQWLIEFTADLGLEKPPIVLGHSFGSIVASAALSLEQIAAALILVNPIATPALQGPRGLLTRGAIAYYALGARLPKTLGTALLKNRGIVRIMSVTMAKTRDRQLLAYIHDQHDRYFNSFANRSSLSEAFKTSVSHTVTEYAAKIAVPTLLIAADRDDIAPPAGQHRLQPTFPDARLRMLHDVGHLIHYERPAEAALHIEEFVSNLES